jgi:hypothetical protein
MNDWIIPGRFDFSIPEAQRLSDLTSVDSDLEVVIRLSNRCERLSASLIEVPESASLTWLDDIQALGDLMFAAVVRYGRTIATGVRQGIPKVWIEALSKESQQSHAYFKALRDKYIAHSVNQLEDNQVFVMLTPQFSEEQQPSNITVDKGRLVTLGGSDLARLRLLAEELRAVVSREIESETARLLAIARQMPVAQIKARGSDSTPIPGKAETFKVRNPFKW